MHAFDFMSNQRAGFDYKYPDGWTAKLDKWTATQWSGKWGGPPTEIEKGLKETVLSLARAASDTDDRSDVTLCTDNYLLALRYGRCNTAIKDTSFTVFSHFLNVPRPADFWEKNGYYFPWVQQHKSCGEFGIENEAILRGSAKLDRSRSPINQYRGTLLVSDKEYDQNFDRYIKDVRFWPAQNVADFWYREFLKSPELDSLPQYISTIGPVLHMVQDVTVPFHAVGISGCGHRDYEAYIGTLYNETSSLYDPVAVREHLTKVKILRRGSTIKDLVIGLAHVTASTCKNSLLGSDCGKVNNRTQAKKLINLAIAANVIVLRKAWVEWEQLAKSHSRGNPSEAMKVGIALSQISPHEGAAVSMAQADSSTKKVIAQVPPIDKGRVEQIFQGPERGSLPSDQPGRSVEIKDIPRREEELIKSLEERVRTLPATGEIRMQPGPEYVQEVQRWKQARGATYSFERLNTELFVAPTLRSYGPAITGPVQGLVNAIKYSAAPDLPEDDLREKLEEHQQALRSVFKSVLTKQVSSRETQIPQRQAHPPLLASQGEPLFRPPTLEEVENESAWAEYVATRKKYVNSVGLLEVSIDKAALQAESDLERNEARKIDTLDSLRDLLLLENHLIDSLRR